MEVFFYLVPTFMVVGDADGPHTQGGFPPEFGRSEAPPVQTLRGPGYTKGKDVPHTSEDVLAKPRPPTCLSS